MSITSNDQKNKPSIVGILFFFSNISQLQKTIETQPRSCTILFFSDPVCPGFAKAQNPLISLGSTIDMAKNAN